MAYGVTLAIANWLVLSEPPPGLRVFGAILLMFALPGAALVAAIFPRGGATSLSERIVLSVGASAALSVIAMWLLFLLPAGFSLPAVVAAFDALGTGLGTIALVVELRRHAPEAEEPFLLTRHTRTLLGMGLVSVAGLALVLIRLNHLEISGDEFSVVTRAIDVVLGKKTSLFTLTKGPAQILLVMNMMRLTDSLSEWILRLPFALSAIIAAAALFALSRSRLRVTEAVLLGILCITEGTLLGMARWVQYQMFVLAMAQLALFCGWRGYQTRHYGSSRRYWTLSAFFGGAGLLGHYDAAMMAPALFYLFLKTHQHRLMSARPWQMAAQLTVVALVICAPFYVLYLRQPKGFDVLASNYGSDRVNLAHAPFSNLGEFVANIWAYESGYRAAVIFALVGVAAVSAIATRRRAVPRWMLAVLGASVFGIVISIVQPAALSAAGMNLSILPFALLSLLFLRFLVRDPFWVAILLWLITVFGFTGFLMERPFDHYFLGLPPLMLVALWGLRTLSSQALRIAGPARIRSVKLAMTSVVLGWLAVITAYTVLENIAYLPAALNIHPENTPWWFSQLAASSQQSPAYYSTAVGWRTVAVLYESGELRGENVATVEASRDYYLSKIWQPQTPAPRYFFVARPQKPGFAKSQPPPDLEETHHLWGIVLVDGEPQIKIYQRNDGATASPVRIFDDADFRNQWQQMATLSRLELFKSNHRDDSAFYALSRIVQNQGQEGDAIMMDASGARAIFNQFYTGALPFIGPDDIARRTPYRRIWGIFWANNPEGSERELASTVYPASLQWISNLRVRMYGVGPDTPLRPNGSHFGSAISLAQTSELPRILRPAELLPLHWQWQAEAGVPVRYKVFVHVTGAQGAPVVQYDGEPLADLRPTSTWQLRETLDDRAGIWMPADMQTGRYQVTMGMYDPISGERLAATAPDGSRYADDALPLGEIEIAGR
jgi:hypothetical protein